MCWNDGRGWSGCVIDDGWWASFGETGVANLEIGQFAVSFSPLFIHHKVVDIMWDSVWTLLTTFTPEYHHTHRRMRLDKGIRQSSRRPPPCGRNDRPSYVFRNHPCVYPCSPVSHILICINSARYAQAPTYSPGPLLPDHSHTAFGLDIRQDGLYRRH
ncbi:hypothetical protein FS749_014855 [Ceratobasidium sp. UAMH 11750]|nr:hypothetical protein FS749_014855 [Ceratobasidium sp. UAMH 11750]